MILFLSIRNAIAHSIVESIAERENLFNVDNIYERYEDKYIINRHMFIQKSC